MEIVYTEEKKFTQAQVQALFLSVDWVSGAYPERLYKALMHSSTVLTAWDGTRLVGLARVLDDTEMTAFLHYVLVDPAYHGCGIGGGLVRRVREKYRDDLYLDIMPEERKNVPFYENLGFRKLPEGTAMQVCNPGEKR